MALGNGRSVMRFFTLELPEAIEPLGLQFTRFNRALHGTARFGVMPAIAEAALSCQRHDVSEDVLNPLFDIRELEFAHAGGIDQPSTAR